MIRCTVEVGIYRDGLPNLRYGDVVDIDETDEGWHEALTEGWLLPVDVAVVDEGEWTPTSPGALVETSDTDDNPEGDGK